MKERIFPDCPIRGHKHKLGFGRSPYGLTKWLRCPKDNHRWVPVKPDLLPLPEFLVKNSFEWEGTTYIRRTMPQWGWPNNWNHWG